jgi:catechol 2,3-dioxygenase-like lactoylglutathione lyase family enzyme
MMSNAVINHVNIPVADLERSVAFYCDVLGFRHVKSFARRDGTVYKAVLEHRGFDVFLQQTDGSCLPPDFHFGLQADRETMIDIAHKLRERSIDVGQGPIESPPGSNTHRFYFRDPDGTVIEVYDWP